MATKGNCSGLLSIVFYYSLICEMKFSYNFFLPDLLQAAIGPVALDLARNSSLDQDKNIQLAKCVLTIAVLSILVTAPLGAMGILSTGPLLLSRSETNESIIDQKSDSDHKQNRERNAESQTIP